MADNFPQYPATSFDQAVDLTIFSSNQLGDVINGDATSVVNTESGDIPTLRKALVDNFYFKNPIQWNPGNTNTVFNQLYVYDTDNINKGWYYAPTATATNPILMGDTPVGDANWKLYSLVTTGIPAQVFPWSTEITQTTASIVPPYEFDTAIVTFNGSTLVPGKDYTIANNTITFTPALVPEPDAEVPDILFCYIGKVQEGDPSTNYVTYNSLLSSGGASLIGTEQGGTVQQALNYLTPEMFGAKGNGITDDRNAIQAAIDKACDNYITKLGPTLVILSGTYLVSLNPSSTLIPGEVAAGRGVLSVRSGVTLSGNGYINLVTTYTGTSSGAVITNWDGSADNITIEGITINCQYGVATGRGITGINIVDSKNVIINKVKVFNGSGGGIYLRRSLGTQGNFGCVASSITNCIVDNTYYIGIQCERPNMVVISNNTITNTGNNGIDCEGNDTTTTNQGVGQGIIIQGNNLSGVKNGIFIESLGNAKVDNNFVVTSGVGVIFNRINSGAFQCTFIGNTLQGSNSAIPSGMGARFINQIGRIIVSDNKVSNFVYGFHFADRIDRMEIKSNFFANISSVILYLDKVSSGVSLLRSRVASQFYMGGQTSGVPFPVSPRNCPSNYPGRMAGTVSYTDVYFSDIAGVGEVNFQRATGTLVLNTSWNAYAIYNSVVTGYTTLNGNFGNVGEYLVINGNTYQIYQTTASSTTITKWDTASGTYISGNFVAEFDQAYTTSTRRSEWGSL